MFPDVKPFHMQPHIETRQPDILKASPWQPCYGNQRTTGGHFREGPLPVIKHNHGWHISRTWPASLINTWKDGDAPQSVLFIRRRRKPETCRHVHTVWICRMSFAICRNDFIIFQEKRVVFVTFVRELPSLITQQSEHTEGHMPRCTVDV